MSPVTLTFVAVSAALVFVIAAAAVGREARRLDAVAPRAVYEIEDAVQFVASRLAAESQARLTFDDLRKLLRAHLRWLHDKGLQPADVIDRRQDIDEDVVVDEDTLTAWLLAEAERREVEVLDDVDVYRVVRAHLEYFEAIGAVGPEADG
ncbi:MAG: hypothetical protein EBW96_00700 [Actinobacteria bacterium]|nr:hypothetical protein [Actinomycetota bacterium]